MPKTVRRTAWTTGSPSPPESGFTLLELLTVLTLVSVLMGIGVGAFKKISLGRRLAVAQVKDALRAARLFAIEQSSGARVDLDPVANVVQSSGFQSTGNWHLEDASSIGWPTLADRRGAATLIDDGAIGSAMLLPLDDNGWLDLGRSPSFDAEQGLLAEAFVRVANDFEGGVLFSKGTGFKLALTPSRTVIASVRVHEGQVSGGDNNGLLHLETTDAVWPERWSRVTLMYDGYSLRLSIDGRERARHVNDERLDLRPDEDANLMVGGVAPFFVGGVDEIRLASVITVQAPPLPEGVSLTAQGTIWFDGRGRLDPNHHQRPVVITLSYDEDRRTREVEVGLLGETR